MTLADITKTDIDVLEKRKFKKITIDGETRYAVFTTISDQEVPLDVTWCCAKNIYNEITNLASGSLTTITTYTVPAGKSFRLMGIEASGSNIAEYTVTRNGANEAKKRSYFTDYNVEFDFKGTEFLAGEVIAVKVEHNRSMVSDHEANIIGIEV